MRCLSCRRQLTEGAVCNDCQTTRTRTLAVDLADVIRLAVQLGVYPEDEARALSVAAEIEAGRDAVLEVPNA